MGNVLITGGAGFIGSHLSDIFADNNYNVVVADNFVNPNSGYRNPKATYIKTDILSNDFEKVFQKYQFDYCIHLAANPSVVKANNNPEFDAMQNIIGSIRTVELCKKYGVKKIIAASSAAVYGNPEYLPVDEKHPTKVLSNYGLSKLTMENYIKLSGLDYIIFRFANVYGERQTTQGEAGVVAIFDNAMKENKDVFIDGDGEQTRDFVYVKDVANVCFKAIISDIKNEIFNISTNTAISINELFENLATANNYNIKPKHREVRTGDIKNSFLDNKKILRTLKLDDFVSLKIGSKNLIHWS